MLENGFILNNRYRIENIVGKGGMSVVYRAVDLEADGAVRAVKEISKIRREIIQSAKHEAQLIKELYERDKYHLFPNIIQRTETGDNLYIIMDFIDGTSLNNILCNGPLPHKTVIEYAKDICSAMQFLHDCGKIYSDMKPDNIMVLNHSGRDQLSDKTQKVSSLKFIDFGAVVHMESGIPQQYTPEYAAPEQFKERKLDKRTDIFNIGATLYHMATGSKPAPVFEETRNRFNFEKYNKTINIHLKQIIKKCVEDTPEKRYRDCIELYKALERAEKMSYIKITAAFAFISVFSAALCAFSWFQANNAAEKKYLDIIETAEKSASYSEKISSYKSAVSMKPERTEAYFGLIETYKEDLIFDNSESSELIQLMTAEMDNLRKSYDYEDLMFETGKLFWYYYDYGMAQNTSNTTTRITSAAEWLKEALTDKFMTDNIQKYQMAKIYYDISCFHSEIQKLVIEGDDSNVYEDYWNSICQMTEFISVSKTETEIILLETYKLALNSLETYSHKFSLFKTKEEQLELFNEIKDNTEKIIATTEKTQALKNDITKNLSRTEQTIITAYKIKKEEN